VKRHLETCRAATELARTALQACADALGVIGDVLGDLADVSESIHLSLASGSGWPEPSPQQTAALGDAVARLSGQIARIALLFARLNEQASSLSTLLDP